MSNKPINIATEVGKQLNFVISSCKLFDEGRYEEALRIAVAARVLFHNTRHSKALIGGHCNAMNLKLLSTTMFKPGIPIKDSHYLGFIGLYPSIAGFKACLDDSNRKENIPWREWWSVEPVMAFNSTHEHITRKQLILACANTDGGAHVDDVKPNEYQRLDEGLGFEMVVRFRGKNTNDKVKFRYANLAALRQIGYEILSSEDLRHLASGTYTKN